MNKLYLIPLVLAVACVGYKSDSDNQTDNSVTEIVQEQTLAECQADCKQMTDFNNCIQHGEADEGLTDEDCNLNLELCYEANGCTEEASDSSDTESDEATESDS